MSDLDFYFFTGSTHTYLTVNRIEQQAAASGVNVNWRPYNLRAMIQETGAATFFPLGSNKRRNMFRDIERRCEKLGISYSEEPQHPIDPDLLILRVALVAAAEGWCPEFAKAHYRRWFLEHAPADSTPLMRELLVSLGKDPDKVLDQAKGDRIQSLMVQSVEDARRLGLFGSPHFVVGTETFWGDDRLEDALEWAAGGGTVRKEGRSEQGTVEFLDAFAQAWNRHDTDVILSMMTEDCVYQASSGPQVSGTEYHGHGAAREGIEAAFAAYPDAQWNEPRHFVNGERGFSEWRFTGTAPDGTRREVLGCDVFTFRDGKISVKNSFRKQSV